MVIEKFNISRKKKFNLSILFLYLLYSVDFILKSTIYYNRYKNSYIYIVIVFGVVTFFAIYYSVKILKMRIVIEAVSDGVIICYGLNTSVNLRWDEIRDIRQIEFNDAIAHPAFLDQLQFDFKSPCLQFTNLPGIIISTNYSVLVNLGKSPVEIRACVEALERIREKMCP